MKLNEKVVCINDDWSMHGPQFFEDVPNRPVKNEIYTIRDLQGHEGGVLLHEVVNKPVYFPLLQGSKEPTFAAHRFRPLDELLNEIQIKESIKLPELTPQLV